MISCSHWGMFPTSIPNFSAASNFHTAMQLSQMAQAANAINQYQQNSQAASNYNYDSKYLHG